MCQFAKKPGAKQHYPMGHIFSSKSLEVVAMDFTVLKSAKDGTKNILVLTDMFTKFMVAILTKYQTAESVTQALISG